MAGGSREIVERFAEALAAADLDAQAALFHDDIVDEYPQSGERVVGKANLRAIVEHYPGTDRRPIHGEVSKLVGANDEWVVGPSFNVTHIAGSGDEFRPRADDDLPERGDVAHGPARQAAGRPHLAAYHLLRRSVRGAGLAGALR